MVLEVNCFVCAKKYAEDIVVSLGVVLRATVLQEAQKFDDIQVGFL